MTAIVRFPIFAAVCALLASCQTGQNVKSNDPYVSNFGNDGAYNPYPGQPGTMQSGGGSTVPTYTPPPQAPTPPPNDPYAFSGPSAASSKPKSPSSSSSTKPKSTASTKPRPKSSTAKTTPKKKPAAASAYKVVPGDTLSGIARKRGTTVAKLKAANKLSSDLIRPGQALKLR